MSVLNSWTDTRGYRVDVVEDENGEIHYELYDPKGNRMNGDFPSMDGAIRYIPPAPEPENTPEITPEIKAPKRDFEP